MAKCQPATQKGYAREKFNQKIAAGNRRPAIPALSAQIEPGCERDVEKPGDGIVAMGTVRRRRDDALPERHPMNADIQEAPYDRSQHEKEHRPEVKWNGGPVLRVEYGREHDDGMTNDE